MVKTPKKEEQRKLPVGIAKSKHLKENTLKQQFTRDPDIFIYKDLQVLPSHFVQMYMRHLISVLLQCTDSMVNNGQINKLTSDMLWHFVNVEGAQKSDIAFHSQEQLELEKLKCDEMIQRISEQGIEYTYKQTKEAMERQKTMTTGSMITAFVASTAAAAGGILFPRALLTLSYIFLNGSILMTKLGLDKLSQRFCENQIEQSFKLFLQPVEFSEELPFAQEHGSSKHFGRHIYQLSERHSTEFDIEQRFIWKETKTSENGNIYVYERVFALDLKGANNPLVESSKDLLSERKLTIEEGFDMIFQQFTGIVPERRRGQLNWPSSNQKFTDLNWLLSVLNNFIGRINEVSREISHNKGEVLIKLNEYPMNAIILVNAMSVLDEKTMKDDGQCQLLQMKQYMTQLRNIIGARPTQKTYSEFLKHKVGMGDKFHVPCFDYKILESLMQIYQTNFSSVPHASSFSKPLYKINQLYRSGFAQSLMDQLPSTQSLMDQLPSKADLLGRAVDAAYHFDQRFNPLDDVSATEYKESFESMGLSPGPALSAAYEAEIQAAQAENRNRMIALVGSTAAAVVLTGLAAAALANKFWWKPQKEQLLEQQRRLKADHEAELEGARMRLRELGTSSGLTQQEQEEKERLLSKVSSLEEQISEIQGELDEKDQKLIEAEGRQEAVNKELTGLTQVQISGELERVRSLSESINTAENLSQMKDRYDIALNALDTFKTIDRNETIGEWKNLISSKIPQLLTAIENSISTLSLDQLKMTKTTLMTDQEKLESMQGSEQILEILPTIERQIQTLEQQKRLQEVKSDQESTYVKLVDKKFRDNPLKSDLSHVLDHLLSTRGELVNFDAIETDPGVHKMLRNKYLKSIKGIYEERVAYFQAKIEQMKTLPYQNVEIDPLKEFVSNCKSVLTEISNFKRNVGTISENDFLNPEAMEEIEEDLVFNFQNNIRKLEEMISVLSNVHVPMAQLLDEKVEAKRVQEEEEKQALLAANNENLRQFKEKKGHVQIGEPDFEVIDLLVKLEKVYHADFVEIFKKKIIAEKITMTKEKFTHFDKLYKKYIQKHSEHGEIEITFEILTEFERQMNAKIARDNRLLMPYSCVKVMTFFNRFKEMFSNGLQQQSSDKRLSIVESKLYNEEGLIVPKLVFPDFDEQQMIDFFNGIFVSLSQAPQELPILVDSKFEYLKLQHGLDQLPFHKAFELDKLNPALRTQVLSVIDERVEMDENFFNKSKIGFQKAAAVLEKLREVDTSEEAAATSENKYLAKNTAIFAFGPSGSGKSQLLLRSDVSVLKSLMEKDFQLIDVFDIYGQMNTDETNRNMDRESMKYPSCVRLQSHVTRYELFDHATKKRRSEVEPKLLTNVKKLLQESGNGYNSYETESLYIGGDPVKEIEERLTQKGHICATANNDASSRSGLVYTLESETPDPLTGEKTQVSIIDAPGTENVGAMFQEGILDCHVIPESEFSKLTFNGLINELQEGDILHCDTSRKRMEDYKRYGLNILYFDEGTPADPEVLIYLPGPQGPDGSDGPGPGPFHVNELKNTLVINNGLYERINRKGLGEPVNEYYNTHFSGEYMINPDYGRIKTAGENTTFETRYESVDLYKRNGFKILVFTNKGVFPLRKNACKNRCDAFIDQVGLSKACSLFLKLYKTNSTNPHKDFIVFQGRDHTGVPQKFAVRFFFKIPLALRYEVYMNYMPGHRDMMSKTTNYYSTIASRILLIGILHMAKTMFEGKFILQFIYELHRSTKERRQPYYESTAMPIICTSREFSRSADQEQECRFEVQPKSHNDMLLQETAPSGSINKYKCEHKASQDVTVVNCKPTQENIDRTNKNLFRFLDTCLKKMPIDHFTPATSRNDEKEPYYVFNSLDTVTDSRRLNDFMTNIPKKTNSSFAMSIFQATSTLSNHKDFILSDASKELLDNNPQDSVLVELPPTPRELLAMFSAWLAAKITLQLSPNFQELTSNAFELLQFLVDQGNKWDTLTNLMSEKGGDITNLKQMTHCFSQAYAFYLEKSGRPASGVVRQTLVSSMLNLKDAIPQQEVDILPPRDDKDIDLTSKPPLTHYSPSVFHQHSIEDMGGMSGSRVRSLPIKLKQIPEFQIHICMVVRPFPNFREDPDEMSKAIETNRNAVKSLSQLLIGQIV